MTPDPTDFPAPAAPPPVGAFVSGSPAGQRVVVDWPAVYAAACGCDDTFDPEAEGYLSLFRYPAGPYCRHFVAAGHTPKGYGGPAACPFLLLDVDRAGDPARALADARALVRCLLGRYGPRLDVGAGLGVWFSGGKGYHVALECLPACAPSPAVPAACKRLALRLATLAGVAIDPACFDHQRLVRLPNSKHPATGRHKRALTVEELFNLDADRVADLARHPAGYPVPEFGEAVPALEDDWRAAAEPGPVPAVGVTAGNPVVPKFVRDFIGFGDVEDPGRAVTLFRCAAALAEAGTPAPVVAGLLEEVALKTGLSADEVAKQLRDGVAHGRRKGGAA